jgi:hypothetical protein
LTRYGIADPGSPQSELSKVPDLQRIMPLRSMLRCVRETG